MKKQKSIAANLSLALGFDTFQLWFFAVAQLGGRIATASCNRQLEPHHINIRRSP